MGVALALGGHVRVLEIIKDFEAIDASAFWHDIKFSLRHLKDFSQVAIVRVISGRAWSRHSCAAMSSISPLARWKLPAIG
jgi:hypothetical protein